MHCEDLAVAAAADHNRTSSSPSSSNDATTTVTLAMLTHIRNVAPRLLHQLQTNVARQRGGFELVWAAHDQWPLLPGRDLATDRLRISVLDSSFNPPTLAHLALANSPRPRRPASDGSDRDYDAKLLLLSVKNVDKTLKPGDATYVERLEMMGLLARDVRTQHQLEDGMANVAIGIIDAPTFVGKSEIITELLSTQLLPSIAAPTRPFTPPRVQLTFIVGMDTLERLFSPRYYPPPADRPGVTSDKVMMEVLSHMLAPEGDDSFIVCANRAAALSAGTPSTQPNLDPILKLTSQRGWTPAAGEDCTPDTSTSAVLEEPKIQFIDIGERESQLSSTAVRRSRETGGHWRDLVTKRVASFIEMDKLYQSRLGPDPAI